MHSSIERCAACARQVMINDLNGALPPNTLFRLKRVMPPGSWSVPGVALAAEPPLTAARANKGLLRTPARGATKPPETSGEVEARVWPTQRLLVVGCTFRPPRAPALPPAGSSGGGAKLCGSVHTLMYASREAYVAGLDEIIAQPALSLAQVRHPPPPAAPLCPPPGSVAVFLL